MLKSGSSKDHRILAEIYSWLKSLILALLIFVLIFIFFFRIISVEGVSMENTLYNGDRLLISNLFYTPKDGDIIIFSIKGLRFAGYPDCDYALVKRVIATEGEQVDIDFNEGTIYVNGVLQDQSYNIDTYDSEDMGKQESFIVPEGTVFVMGDNRQHSTDSRCSKIGFVDTRYILGHVLLRFAPLNSFGLVE